MDINRIIFNLIIYLTRLPFFLKEITYKYINIYIHTQIHNKIHTHTRLQRI